MGIFAEYKWHYQDWNEGLFLGFVAGSIIVGTIVALALL